MSKKKIIGIAVAIVIFFGIIEMINYSSGIDITDSNMLIKENPNLL